MNSDSSNYKPFLVPKLYVYIYIVCYNDPKNPNMKHPIPYSRCHIDSSQFFLWPKNRAVQNGIERNDCRRQASR